MIILLNFDKKFNEMKHRFERFKIGSFNARTVQSSTRQHQLAGDVNNYSLDEQCIQETKVLNWIDITIKIEPLKAAAPRKPCKIINEDKQTLLECLLSRIHINTGTEKADI